MQHISLGVETASNVLSVTEKFVGGVTNVVDVIGAFVPLVSNITNAIREIQDICESIEYNKRMCGTLLERALFAEAATKALMIRTDYYEKKLRSREFYDGFRRFAEVIEKIKEFTKTVSRLSGLRKFFQASDIKSRFTILLEEFDGLMNVLQFSMVARSSDISYIILQDLEELKNRIEGGITKRDTNEILINPNIEEIEVMNVAWKNGTLPTNSSLFSSVMINPNLITDNSVKQISKKIEQAFYKDQASGTELVALRRLTDPDSIDEQEREKIMKEILIFKRLKDCKHIIEFYGLVERDTGIYLVTQWADNGNLKKFYTEHHAMTHWSVKSKIAVDIARALTFLHSVSIYHHDLRSENILITDRYAAKLANFSKRYTCDCDYSFDKLFLAVMALNSINKISTLCSRCFSAETTSLDRTLERMRYMAPEKIEKKTQRYNLKCEIFRLLWEISECKTPLEEHKDLSILKTLVCDPKNALQFNPNVPKEWKDIANKAMQYSTNLRPPLSEIFNVLFDISETFNDQHTSNLNTKVPNHISNPDIGTQNLLSVRDALMEHKKPSGNKKAAFEAFKVHAERGDIKAKYWYAYYLNKGDVPDSEILREKERLQKAVALFKETADEGFPDGQFRYGYCLWYGKGVTKNVREAIKYFEMSAAAGNSTAMYTLGDIYYKGLEVKKDKEKGAKYLRHAALLKHEKALKMCRKEHIPLA
ncbi:1515_t:CDS:2 [Acaulospora colombiana]|uniref:1515_t:CDS:1 n=1 Tax=Acaulospora colombiana TaxID=27376 RepID=A0ACA9K7Y0_9GLOM|nr:1515_t:CDS:2 [Acaulospora colombiana]